MNEGRKRISGVLFRDSVDDKTLLQGMVNTAVSIFEAGEKNNGRLEPGQLQAAGTCGG